MTLAEEWAAWRIRAAAVDAETGPGARWAGLRALCTPHGRALRYTNGHASADTEGWCMTCEPIEQQELIDAFPGWETLPERTDTVGRDRKRGD